MEDHIQMSVCVFEAVVLNSGIRLGLQGESSMNVGWGAVMWKEKAVTVLRGNSKHGGLEGRQGPGLFWEHQEGQEGRGVVNVRLN